MLIGSAGVGKTGLAGAAADRLASQFHRVDWVRATAPAVPFSAFNHLIEVPDTGHTLVELLTHVALSATKAGVDPGEPLCQLTQRHAGASAEVRLAIRIAEFSIDASAAPTA